MPEKARLSQRERDVAEAFIRERWTNPLCPFHGPTTWEFDETLAEVRPYYGPGQTILGGGAWPLISVMCGTCGYTVLLNAIKAGVLTKAGASAVEEPSPATAKPAPTEPERAEKA
jgi:hypothetical protein